MDHEAALGLVAALAWLGLFLYLPWRSARDAGSLRAWLLGRAKDPIGSVGGGS